MAMNMMLVKAGNALAILGGDTSLKDLNKIPDNMDGGIRPYARPLFARWVAAMRRAEDNKAPSGSAIVDGAQNLIQFVAKMLNDPSANPQSAGRHAPGRIELAHVLTRMRETGRS